MAWIEGVFVVSPINSGPTGRGVQNTSKTAVSDAQTNRVDATHSSSINIPNDSENYHWFLTELSGSRTTITATMNGNHRISANTNVNDIVSYILGHVGV